MGSFKISSKGYVIPKSNITQDHIRLINKELIVEPIQHKKFAFAKEDKRFSLFQESSECYYVPRHWGVKNIETTAELKIKEGLDFQSGITFNGTPYNYQKSIIKNFKDAGSNGIISIPCGKGKTFIAIYCAVLLKKRFLVVVDKEFLMNQWKDEIHRFVNNIRVGIIQGPICETDPSKYDCTICMIQTICQRDYPEGFFEAFGFTIFDECHHLGAQHFSTALTKIQTKHMLGLSATPDRDDGLSKVFHYFLGDMIYRENREEDRGVKVFAIWYKNDDKQYNDIPLNWRGDIITARLINQILEFKPRTGQVVAIIKNLFCDPKRNILVLSDRRSHLEEIFSSFSDHPHNSEVGFYVGGMKQEDLDNNAKTCRVLLATYAMASEAMNIKTLNALVMASPRKKVEQSTGRILRVQQSSREIEPIIYDIIDQHEIYTRQWYQRQRYYKKCSYNIFHVGREKKENDEINTSVCAIRI